MRVTSRDKCVNLHIPSDDNKKNRFFAGAVHSSHQLSWHLKIAAIGFLHPNNQNLF